MSWQRNDAACCWDWRVGAEVRAQVPDSALFRADTATYRLWAAAISTGIPPDALDGIRAELIA